MKTKRGPASEKCRKKAGRSSTFDSEVWRPRIEEHNIITPTAEYCLTSTAQYGSVWVKPTFGVENVIRATLSELNRLAPSGGNAPLVGLGGGSLESVG